MTIHVFVLGLDEFHRRLLDTVKNASDYRFHGLLDYDAVVNPLAYDIDAMRNQALAALEPYRDTAEIAIIGHWDFPTTTLLAVLRRELDLRGPHLENVMLAEHKYWCRLRQRAVVPEMTPAFQSLDPFATQPEQAIELDYPFWIKPVVAFSSQMAYRVEGPQDQQRALADIRRRIGLFGRPFDRFLEWCDMPDDIPVEVDAHHCIVEQPIDGRQCTLEGYIQYGRAHVYGVVDSFREGRHRSSFSRYQYPSGLPLAVQRRMIDAACRVIEGLGLDHTPFNVEFYWHSEQDRIWLLEVNPRISKSHSPLFADVEGASHHEVAIDLALGREPDFPRGEGRFPMAAKFMLRRHRDGVVIRVPTEAELDALRREFPGTHIEIAVHEGQRLSDMRGQEAYSYEVAVVFTGARDQEGLLRKARAICERLPLAFDDGRGLEVKT